MGDIVQLPDPGHRTWRIFHQMLGDMAKEYGYSAEVIESALGELKPLVLEAYQFLEGPGRPIASQEDWAAWIKLIDEWVKGFALRVLIIALLAKLELKDATSPGSKAPGVSS